MQDYSTQVATDISAFLIQHDDLSLKLRDKAENQFAEMESRVCPRVIADAREFASNMDTYTIVEYLLAYDLYQRVGFAIQPSLDLSQPPLLGWSLVDMPWRTAILASITAVLNRRVSRWVFAIAWSVWICILLLQPEANPIIDLGLPSGPQTLVRETFFTSLHVIAFATTCALWCWTWLGHLRLQSSLVIACVIAIAMGAATESLQSLTPDRHPSLFDFAANVVGTFLAARLIWQRHRVQTTHNPADAGID